MVIWGPQVVRQGRFFFRNFDICRNIYVIHRKKKEIYIGLDERIILFILIPASEILKCVPVRKLYQSMNRETSFSLKKNWWISNTSNKRKHYTHRVDVGAFSFHGARKH